MTAPPTSPPPSGPVWAKRVGDRAGQANVAYCAGRDVVARPAADALLLDADLWTNRAHCLMLLQQGILAREEAAAILGALEDIRARAERGQFAVAPECEDVHMAVEAEVARLAGPGAGGRLHTGRSRNDQTTTDVRLWTRGALLRLLDDLLLLLDALRRHAAEHRETVCPGFTHMQPAMATSWAHVVAAWAQGLLRDVERLAAAYETVNRSPLGAAASFGTSWPIDRETTARLLGFVDAKGRPVVQENTLDCVSSRGEPETQAVFALAMLMNRLAGIGQDLILLSTPPRAWVRLDDRFVTGSSIMPQKRNPDFAEVTRAKAATVAGIAVGLLGIGRAAPAGYNRDSQWTKYLAMDAVAEVEGAAAIFAGVFETLRVDAKAMRAACRVGFMNAAEVAEALAAESGMPFRACYRTVAEAVARREAAGELDRATLNAVLAEHHAAADSESEAAKQSDGKENAGEAKAETKKDAGPTKARIATRPFRVSATLWKSLEDPLGLLRRRDQTGSPHPERVASLLDALGDRTKAERARVAELARRIDVARRETDRATQSLLANRKK